MSLSWRSSQSGGIDIHTLFREIGLFKGRHHVLQGQEGPMIIMDVCRELTNVIQNVTHSAGRSNEAERGKPRSLGPNWGDKNMSHNTGQE